MEWYYAVGKQQIGPLSDVEFSNLVDNGTIASNTLVWNRTMKGWTEYGKITGMDRDMPTGEDRAVGSNLLHCSECGRPFPENEMISYNNTWVCATCKPVFIQKIKEGVDVGWSMDYAGFWIRVGASIIDWIALYVIIMVVIVPLQILTASMAPGIGPGDNSANLNVPFFILMTSITVIIQLGVPIAYETWFVGKFAATPGKMACRIKVINADGSRVSYLKAFGRYFAKMLSGLVLLIGYIMVAFDSEKRGLHDHICNTRVIRK
jgi:uncharacterized RDD family membrane protein YckC